MDVYISGVGMTKFGRSKEPLEKMMAEAASSALREAQLERVDAIYMGVMNVEEFVGDSNFATLLADTLGLTGVPSTRVETASSTGAGAFEAAFYAVASGHMKHVLALAGEKMTHLPTAKTTRILSEVIDRSERRYGATMPALAAMIAQKYGREFNLSPMKLEDVLAQVAIKNHSNGSFNPYAQFRKVITKEDYLKSQMVSFPLRLYDCAPITDGAAAIILTSESTPIKVAGIGHATDTAAVAHRASLTSFNSTKEAAQKAYAMAQLNPSDVHFAEVHDAFTLFEIIGTEDLGLFPQGKGWKALEEGVTHLRGRLPINPSGGLKARGHPVGASGLAQLVEIVYQLKEEAGKERQLERAEIGLAQSIGGLGNNNLVTILERNDRRRIVKQGWSPDYHPEIKVLKKIDHPSPTEGAGILETFTTLYATPEGFLSPLTIGFVKTDLGEMVMACNPDYRSPKELKMGKKVYLRKREGLNVFEKFTLWSRLKHRLKRQPKNN
ncbi:MAG TPA: thiolase family protein [Thermodesulfobacteriota bacterium]|jgi:acetyl-CoA acetyltransferase|nr:thiolase family protein [Thermodesulfobacteriota bacterium]